MQTHFTKEQLQSADIARADAILRKCVHCGFCTATCPTYLVTGDERDSPRGRIWLIRDMLEDKEKDETARIKTAATTQHHLDRCLTCLACMTTCPSGVDYMHLVDIGRDHASRRAKRGRLASLQRKFLLAVLTKRLPAWGLLTFAWALRGIGFNKILPRPLSQMLDIAPRHRPRLDSVGSRDTAFPATGSIEAVRRVVLHAGCAQRAIDPDINAATIRLLHRCGVEVVVRHEAQCCGGLHHHSCDHEGAKKHMTACITAWHDEQSMRGMDAVISNASGCGVIMKDYGDAFRNDSNSALRDAAAAVAAKTFDITEYIHRIGLPPVNPEIAKQTGSVTYHAACSMQHGQGLTDIPKELLRAAGFDIRIPHEAHICCGSAGVYNALQGKMAGELRTRKISHLNAAGGSIIVAGNLGCMNQLSTADAPIVHIVELLDWATGGPRPAKLKNHQPTGGT